MRIASLPSLTLLITLAACGADAAPTPADNYAAATREVADAWCAAATRCCDAAELAPIIAELGFTSPEQCSAAFVAKSGPIEDGLRAGRLTLDATAMAECQRQLAEATCDRFAAVEAVCARVVRGAIADGAACDDDSTCTSGWCGDPGLDEQRRCVPVPAVGETCTGRCGDGAFCQPGASGGSTCVTGRADGAACDVDGQCAGSRCSGAAPAAGIGGVCATTQVCDGV